MKLHFALLILYLTFSIVSVFADEPSTFQPFVKKLQAALQEEQSKLHQLQQSQHTSQVKLQDSQKKEQVILSDLAHIQKLLRQLAVVPPSSSQDDMMSYSNFEKRIQNLYVAYLATQSSTIPQLRLQHKLIARLLVADLQAWSASHHLDISEIAPKIWSLRNQTHQHLLRQEQQQKQELFIVKQNIRERQKFLQTLDIVPLQNRVRHLKKQLTTAKRLVSQAEPPINWDNLTKPVQGRSPITRKTTSTPTQGFIFESQKPMKVHAVADGRVVFSDVIEGLSRVVIIEHRLQKFSVYGRLNRVQVQRGQFVSANETLGDSKKSGQGFQVYFEVR